MGEVAARDQGVATITVGVDFASQAADTALCWLRWQDGGATVERVEPRCPHVALAALLRQPAAKIGLDVPLGWPDGFVEGVARHREGRPFGGFDIRRMTRRETDNWVHDNIHQLPLSVSTDHIAYPAMKMAALLGELPGGPVDRTGMGRFVEVYPAAALRVWQLRHRAYKGPENRSVLIDLIETLRQRCPWLDADAATWEGVTRTDHAFDALVCALVARAQQRGLCHPIPAGLREAATREGWIAVPQAGSLEALPGGGGAVGADR
jgi:hypothetical protein